MKIPNRTKCLALLRQYCRNEFKHIIEHCNLVNKVAVFLAKKLREAGEEVNVKLVDAASLLHDIGKPAEIKQKAGNSIHHVLALKILKEFPEVAEVVKKHVLSEAKNCKTWEEKIVCYADSRVAHQIIVSLDERLADLRVRYPKHIKEIDRYAQHVKKIEEEIFSKLAISKKLREIVK